MKNFYTANLVGGLGNQMFQISNCLSQSWDNGVECKFIKNSNTTMQGNNTSMYIDNLFRKIPFYDDIVTEDIGIYENSFSYKKIISPKDKNVRFHGYFQSSKYFENYKDKIKEIFQPEESFLNEISKKYPEILLDNTLSLHIRRGDYLSFSEIHPSVDNSYVEQALKFFENYSYIFIFSDDAAWSDKNFNLENSIVVKDNKDYEDLWLMSLCKNNIICNSTFSWWAAFLNKNPNKKIISPSIWFGPRGPRDSQDIFEEYWIKINTNYKNGKICY
jgi:hypothetical protein